MPVRTQLARRIDQPRSGGERESERVSEINKADLTDGAILTAILNLLSQSLVTDWLIEYFARRPFVLQYSDFTVSPSWTEPGVVTGHVEVRGLSRWLK